MREHHSELVSNRSQLPSLMAGIAVTLLISYSYYWNIENLNTEKFNLALAEARANWNKDLSFRQWATGHGGVYVIPDEKTPPNPALAHLPDRDVITTDGTRLTLMNPAYMMRQMTEEFEETYGVKGKITGKKQLNPNNKPDDWQLKALDKFEADDSTEFYEQLRIKGKPYLRYMKPLYMTEGCVKCHSILGYKDGDLRGGISVSIPLAPYFASTAETSKSIITTHLIVWLMAILAIFLFYLSINRLLARMAHEALHDGLTGLPNLTLFKNRLEQALKKSHRVSDYRFAICFIDLDRFKVLNDSKGHTTGDKLLVALSQRLSKLLRPGDTLARMGGDEFTLLLEDVDGLTETLNITERLLDSFNKPFSIGNDDIYTNASIGICMATEKYKNVNDLIRDADIAMYRAKSSGKGRIDVFNPEMHQTALTTMQIENDLRSAIQKGQLEIYYQPVINIQNTKISGFEALLRWHHPTLGMVTPDRFIPIAENTGQIKKIGSWVMEEACKQTREWSLQFCPDREFNISVNLSTMQLVDDDILNTIDKVITTSHFNKTHLYLEVTETALIERKEQAQKIMGKIHDLGISISVDDFGKGYCSLTYLQDFEFNILKIDKDFVQDMGPEGKGLQLIRTLLLLARDLDMQVIAEGVETADQLNRLRALHCHSVQGYYFSRPLPAQQIHEILLAGCHEDAMQLLQRQEKLQPGLA